MFGLKSQDVDLIIETLQKHSDLQEAIIYGSRAMGNYKPGSDIDIALKGTLKQNTLIEISGELNEGLPLPYKFDLVEYNAITHQPLIDHINQYGQTLFKR